jgi:hypothetical protein
LNTSSHNLIFSVVHWRNDIKNLYSIVNL